MPSSIRSRRLPTPNKPSIRARQAAINASQQSAGSSRGVVDQITATADARPFLRMAREALDGKILHYSDRMRLLREAEQMGIARFEANLLIATVQHRAQTQSVTDVPLAASPATTSRTTRILLLTTALLTAEFIVLRFVLHAVAG